MNSTCKNQENEELPPPLPKTEYSVIYFSTTTPTWNSVNMVKLWKYILIE